MQRSYEIVGNVVDDMDPRDDGEKILNPRRPTIQAPHSHLGADQKHSIARPDSAAFSSSSARQGRPLPWERWGYPVWARRYLERCAPESRRRWRPALVMRIVAGIDAGAYEGMIGELGAVAVGQVDGAYDCVGGRGVV